MRKTVGQLGFCSAILLAAFLAGGCQTPEEKGAEAELRQQMARVKERTDRRQAAQEELVRRKIEEHEARRRGESPPVAAQAPKTEKEVAGGASVPAAKPASTDAKSARSGWQEDVIRDLKNYPKNLKEDTLAMVAKENLLENAVVLGAGTSLAVVSKNTSWDKNVARTFDHHDRFGAATNVADVLGHPGLHFGVAGLAYLYGEAYKDYGAAETGRRLFEALAINGLMTLGLQAATNQQRPNGDRMAFPSGHTSSSFAMAAVLDGMYGPLVGIPMYGLAGFIGAARLDANKHYLSDVIAGAALGYVIGRTVTKTSRKREVLGFQVDPWLEEETGAGGVQMRKRF